MRREYINYPSDLPVTISYVSIKEYPIHWHNSIEILFVLKGSITVSVDTDNYELMDRELEIINVDEAHRIYSSNDDNRVLIFHIDPYFFEKYYSDIENMVFYTNSSDDGAQESEKYDVLRTFLAIILCEFIQRGDNFDEEIESTLVNLLYHLINNFHYLMYEKEDLKENEEQLERYHRIAKFIFNNYNNNITLQDIAKKEFLSTHYLSHEIKSAIGYSFTDLINLTRIEESVKLLLDTDKTLSEISEDVGFSHTRYFNKHFKNYYKCTPLQYRKKYKVNEANFEKQKKLELLLLPDSINYLNYYLEDYDRFNYENKITKINIDMASDLGEFNKTFKECLNVGDAFDLLIEDNKDILDELQEEIGFNFVRLLNVFSKDMGIFPGAKFYNFNRACDVFEYVENLNLKPLIILDDTGFTEDEFIEVIVSFLDYFNELEIIDLSSFKFQFSISMNENIRNNLTNLLENEYNLEILTDNFFVSNSIDLIYDTAYMLPFIIYNTLNYKNDLAFLRAFDVLDRQINLTNEVFFGYPGLVNDKGIKKPAYYAYYLLNKLGDTLVSQGEDYIVTKNDSEYQILIYSYNEELNNLVPFNSFSKLRGVKNTAEKKISLNITNINNDTIMTKYEISETFGSSFNYWKSMGKPKRLSKEEKEILHKASFPKIDFKYNKKSTVLNLQTKLIGYGSQLIILKEVQKHLK
ncbi:transcriptional regulator, AraC family [Clostridium cavendishii DSM 21758]|uniref:Transcriptional regulator, AraC family n=1 Tax=Clostridium cavendishii DSM 21758 TaxID=1121302 RepID=A0A1M6CKS7_9CLOT|nr:helix-turn-helix domain-containing protein [Clostridium cavendishii]SHI61318.1 transcriptional regulator, AraC family [Clostridium cavendishii DSM 21758]